MNQCALLASNLEDDLRLTLDQLGNVIGIDYRTATADCSAQASDNLVQSNLVYKSLTRALTFSASVPLSIPKFALALAQRPPST